MIERIQRRVAEIGMVGRLAHNLAKYRVGISGAYTASEFLFEAENYMRERQVPEDRIRAWMTQVKAQAAMEEEFFITNGRFADSTGGSSIYIGALIGPILDQLGYGGERI